MAGGAKPEIIASIGAEFDGTAVAEGMRKMGTDWGKRMRQIEKKSQESMKGTGKSIKQFMWQMGGAKKAYKQLYETQVKSLRGARQEYVKSIKEMREAETAVKALQKAMEGIDKIKEPDLFEDMSKQIDRASRELDKARSKAEKAGSARSEALEGVKEVKEGFTFDREEVVDSFKEAGAELWSPFESLLNKDLPGALEKGGKLVGKGWEALFDKSGKITRKFGKFLGGADTWKGMGKVFKERWHGGGVSGKAKAVGGALGGGAMKAMSSMLGLVSKIGPLLMSVSSIITGIVTVFLQADAAAKDFNKSVMSTAGSGEYLGASLGDADLAGIHLKKTLADMYSQATAFSNIKWGISKEQFIATQNAITAEGVSLLRLEKEYKSATGYAKSFGDAVKMSVGYASAFGVSLQEIGQFEGEMMSEMGDNLDQVESSFQFMLHGAAEAGIATNKFFGIIRGFSADMTLFNIRMEDVTKTMIMLGKAMSPREAQKMLSSLTTMFKGTSLLDRTRDVIMAGPAGRKAMEEQQAAGVTGMAEEYGLDEGDLKKALKFDRVKLTAWLSTNGKKLTKEQTEAVFEASLQQRKLDSGNAIDLASAIKNANPWTAKKIADAKVAAITNGKKIEDLTGVNRVAAEQAAGVSDDMQDSIAKLEMGVALMKTDLAAKLVDAQGDESKFTDEEKKLLTKMKVNIKDSSTFAKLNGATSEQFYNSLSKSQKENLDDGKKQIDYQMSINDQTVSINDRIGILVDFLMGAFYQGVMGIYDIIKSVMGKSDAKKEELEKLQRDAVQSGDLDMLKAIKDSGGDLDKLKSLTAAQATKRKDENDKLIKSLQEQIAATKAQRGGGDKKTLDALQKKLDDAQKTDKKITEASQVTKAAVENANDAIQKSAAQTERDKDSLKLALIPVVGPLIAVTRIATDRLTSSDAVGGKIEMTAQGRAHAEAYQAQKQAGAGASTSGGGFSDIFKALDPATLAKAQVAAQTNSISGKADKVIVDSGGGSIFTHDETAEKTAEATQDLLSDSGDSLDDIYRVLRFRGIVLDKPFLANSLKPILHDATYEAAGDALADYYMLTHTDSKEVMDAIQKGQDPRQLGKAIKTAAVGGGGNVSDTGQLSDVVKPKGNAAGGVITAVRNGMAVVRPGAGEGVLTGRPGERIGAGGGDRQIVEVVFKGDAGKLLDARTQNVIARDKTASQRR